MFDTIVAAALKLASASSANLLTFDGKLIHLAALVNLSAEGAEAMRRLWPRPPSRDMAAGRAILGCSAVAVPDVLEDPDFAPRATAAVRGFRSVLAVPLVHEGCPIGAIAVGRPQPGPFPDKQIALLQTFADQAVIAIENVRLFTELEARTAELTQSVGELRALGEIGQAVSSTLDLGTVLSTIVSRANQLAGMDAGASTSTTKRVRSSIYTRRTTCPMNWSRRCGLFLSAKGRVRWDGWPSPASRCRFATSSMKAATKAICGKY